MSIQKLSDHVINQIAAGEVVERPASVVKELIENSLDAEATLIEVSLIDGGKQLIQVTDDGKGIELNDLALAFERHATSKIGSMEDLLQVQTMGFRGEALASIGSVARVTLETRAADSDQGWRIAKIGPNLTDPEPTAKTQGTTIKVEDLFANVPVRQKYFKTATTEYRYIAEIILAQAAANPKVQFRLIDSGKVKIDYPVNENLQARAMRLLAIKDVNHLIHISYQSQDMVIDGYLAKPQFAVKNRKKQFVAINKRPLQVPFIGHAIKEAMHTLMPHDMYPAFVVNIQIDPTAIDVNVHPRKTEAKFVYQQYVYQKMKASTKATLEKNVLTAELNFGSDKVVKPYPAPVNFSRTNSAAQPSWRYSEPVGGHSNYAKPQAPAINQAIAFNQGFSQERQHQSLSIQPIAQIDKSYIIGLDADGLVVIDQHAAHERVRYAHLQKLRAEFKADQETRKQQLLTPLAVELSESELTILREYLAATQKAGFDFEIKENSVLVLGIPAALIKDPTTEVVRGLVCDLQKAENTETNLTDMEARIERVLNYTACRSAIKFGQALTLEEQKALVAELDALETDTTCPHGRPTRIKIPFKDLEKEFGR